MALSPGTRLGAYEIGPPVGAGGMGEVYRAHDARLHRDVAIKVLPDLFLRDPERLARFEREARTLAALNHPNIAQVYGTVDLVPGGAAGAGTGLVMELVEGEDLSQRIGRGALPVDEALSIALQIAEALRAAHDQGIVHRDLKPANIKLRGDGIVKVLDFGLAKALDPPAADGAPGVRLEDSPTVTSPFQMSQLGVILGTAAYMAPEQAKGKPVDKRADIWAFGCVLYEMLTGRRPFAGEDVTDTLAAIVRADPDWSALPADTPPAIRTLLRRCLEKDRRERLPDIGAARLELKEKRAVESVAPASRQAGRRGALVPWALFTLAALAAAYAVATRPAPDVQVIKAVIVPPAPLTGAPALRLAIAPDGRSVAFVAPDPAGNTMLWVRSLDATEARPLAGTLHASAPFWSADSRAIAFVADGKLRRIEAVGGAVIPLASASAVPPGTWSRDGVIVFSGAAGPLYRMPASGGALVQVTRLAADRGERIHITPFFLPDARHFLYTATTGRSRALGIVAASIDSTETTRLVEAASNAQYANGFLLFLRGTTLMAQRFDPGTLKLSGEPRQLAVDIQTNPATGTGAFSVSQTGVLVYQTGSSSGTLLVWRDLEGKDQGYLGTQAGSRDVQLSPDGRHASVALPTETMEESDVWIFDVTSGARRRFTFGGVSFGGVWSEDGRRIAYAARRRKVADLFQRDVAGSGPEETLVVDDSEKYPLGFSRDGQFLLYAVQDSAARGKLWLLPLQGDRKPRPVMNSGHNEIPGELSPDGHWLAYVSDETGRREVYVVSFPQPFHKEQISTDGGEAPRWSADGRTLFLIANDRLLAASVSVSASRFELGAIRSLFDVHVPAPALGTRSSYALLPDAARVLLNMWDPRTSSGPIVLVKNWTAELGK